MRLCALVSAMSLLLSLLRKPGPKQSEQCRWHFDR
jgi:hypothetical protein